MKKKKPASTAPSLKLPPFNCVFCGEEVPPTEDSIRRLLVRGPKEACPFYICTCKPTELQVFPNWHKITLKLA